MAATHPDDVLTEAIEVAGLPSVVGVCFVGGRVCWTGGAGQHAAIGGRPASPADQYRIGSITKTMTAAAVLQLRDAGRLDLADPVSRHVPDAPFGDHSLRALLAHSSGMPAEPVGAWWERERGVGRDVLWRRNRDRADVFAAGERYHYSNLSFALLGAVVEQVSGVAWMEYVAERLLVPLQMDTTTYHPTGRAADGTSRTPDGRLVPEPAEDTGAMAPAGQLWSTVGDLARWGGFLAVGAPGVLDRGTLVEMQTVQSGDPTSQHDGGYGLGQRLLWTPGGTVVGHSGSMPGFLADLQVDPRTGAGAAVLMNATTTARTHETGRLLRQWAAEQTDAAPAGDPAHPPWGAEPLLARIAGGGGVGVEELVGPWYWGNTSFELTRTEHGCCLRRPGSTWHFAAQTPDRFLGLTGYVAGEVLQVRRLGDGQVDALEVATFVLRRVSSPG